MTQPAGWINPSSLASMGLALEMALFLSSRI